MKKKLAVMVTLILSLVLVACGGEIKEKTFVHEEDKAKIEIEYTYNDKSDKILTQTTKNEVTYDYLEFVDKEEAKEEFQSVIDEMNEIKGVKYEIEFDEDYAVEITEIDYKKLDFDQADKIPGFSFKGDPSNGVSMNETAKALETMGYSEK